MIVGHPGEADPDRFGDAVDLDEADSGQAVRDLVTAGAAVPGAGSEDQTYLVGFGEPWRDPYREQVSGGQGFFAGILDGADDGDADRATLGEQQAKGVVDAPATLRTRLDIESAARAWLAGPNLSVGMCRKAGSEAQVRAYPDRELHLEPGEYVRLMEPDEPAYVIPRGP